MQENVEALRRDQIEILWKAEQISDDGDEPVVVPRSDIEALREALGGPLTDLGLSENVVENMSLEALAAAVAPSDDGTPSPVTERLAQRPETGGESGDDLAEEQADAEDEPVEIAALSADERDEVRDKLRRAAIMDGRTPRHAEDLRQEALAMVPGVESFDELEIEGEIDSV